MWASRFYRCIYVGKPVLPLQTSNSIWPRMDWQSFVGIVDHDTGQLTSTLVDLPILPVGGKSQDDMADLLKNSLATHPAELDSSVLHARFAVGCGDGQLVRGGPDHRHPSSGAMEALWQAVHPSTNIECTFWDPFHP